MLRIEAIYRVAGGEQQARAVASAIAYEQTVELPEGLVTDPGIIEGVVGTVESIEPDAGSWAPAESPSATRQRWPTGRSRSF